jgi:hypothetical protein
LVPGQRYQVRILLNDAGAVFPAGHKMRVALSTSYWPMIWPSPERATVTVFGGFVEFPVRTPAAADALLPPLSGPETAPPEPTTEVREGVVRIDRLGLEVSSESHFNSNINDDDPLSAVVKMRQSQVISRGAWRIRIETEMEMSCDHDAFLLQAIMRAFEGDMEVCRRGWDYSVPRNFA